MKAIKWILIIFIIFLMGTDIYLSFETTEHRWRKDILYTLLSVLMMLWVNNKWTYLFGLILCSGGLYNLFFIASKASAPTSMEFTTSLVNLLDRSSLRRIVDAFPLSFYFFYLLFMISKWGRKFYGVQWKEVFSFANKARNLR